MGLWRLRLHRPPPLRRLRVLKRKRHRTTKVPAQAPPRAASLDLPETALRNIALEAVRVGNFYAEDQQEVLRYIAEVHAELLADAQWLRKNRGKLRIENGLTRRYSVPEILCKKHEADGFDIFTDPDEAVLLAERAAKDSEKTSRPQLPPEEAQQIQEGLEEVVASEAGTGGPVGCDEVLELLERSVAGGEVAAAVYLSERVEAYHDGQLPQAVAEKLFQMLKPLLRPSASAMQPQLVGPWMKSPSGRFGMANPRKGLGRVLDRLSAARKDKNAQAEAKVAEAAEVMQRFCASLLPLLNASEEVARCCRRGRLAALVATVCQQNGLEISPALAQAVLQHFEGAGLLHSKGRDISLQTVDGEGAVALRSLYTDVPLLEAMAKKRMDRRRQRQQAREAAKRRKKQRTE